MMTIEAMKQALEASKDECVKYAFEKTQSILEQAIAEAEKQEPVAWLHKETALLRKETNKPKGADWDADHWNPLYTYPQPRKPLTDEQKKSIARRAFKDICKNYPVQDRIILVINDIEAAHGIKE
jgi:hypothetical protein